MATDFNVLIDSSVVEAFSKHFQQNQGIGILIGKKEDTNLNIVAFKDVVEPNSFFKEDVHMYHPDFAVGYYLVGEVKMDVEFAVLKQFAKLYPSQDRLYDLPLKLELDVKQNKINVYNCISTEDHIMKFNEMKCVVCEEPNTRKYKNRDNECFFLQVYGRDHKLHPKLKENNFKNSDGKISLGNASNKSSLCSRFKEYFLTASTFTQGTEFFFDPSIHNYNKSKDYISIFEHHCLRNHFQYTYNFYVDFMNGIIEYIINFKPLEIWVSEMGNTSYQAKQNGVQKLLSMLRMEAFWDEGLPAEQFWFWKGPQMNVKYSKRNNEEDHPFLEEETPTQQKLKQSKFEF